MGLNRSEFSSATPAAASWLRQLRSRPIFLITLAAAILRLAFITQPALWGDEALTYSRVCGTYRQLIDVLQRDGFVPLHYELYWAIARFFQLTPIVIRIVPIVSGILFVPAMYFLARQLVSEKTANLVAMFTACSAFMLVYSRDAKMYPMFWLFAVLMMAFYLWWLRTPTRVLWLAWIACGVAMAGLQTLGLILLGLLPIFLLTDRKPHWKKMLCMLLGVAIISAGPAGYYLKFNRLIERSEEQNFGEASGTSWVRGYNLGRSGPNHVLFCATGFLLGWEWPREVEQPRVNSDTLLWNEFVAYGLLGFISLGVFRWRGKADERSSWHPWWRIFLWLGIWIVIPSYIFYCRSIADFDSPEDWINSLGSLFGQRWLAVAGCALAASAVMLFSPSPSLLREGRGEGELGLVETAATQKHPRSGPGPEYWARGLALILIILVLNGFVLPWHSPPLIRFLFSVVVIMIGVVLRAAAGSNRQRMLKLLIFCAVAFVVLLLCQGIAPLFDKHPIGSVWVPRYIAIVWPAFAIAISVLILRLPGRALRWAVIGVLLVANFTRAANRVMANFNIDSSGHLLVTGSEPPMDQMARDVVDSDTGRRDADQFHSATWRPASMTRTYVAHVEPVVAGPGMGNIVGTPGRYYLAIFGDNGVDPFGFRSMMPGRNFYVLNDTIDAHTIARQTSGATTINRIIVWQILAPDAVRPVDPLIGMLGHGWDLANIQFFSVRQHWIDTDLETYRRLEYVRRPADRAGAK